MRSEFIDTLIIGGGQAGLAMSHDGRYGSHPEHGEFRARDAWISAAMAAGKSSQAN